MALLYYYYVKKRKMDLQFYPKPLLSKVIKDRIDTVRRPSYTRNQIGLAAKPE